MDQKQINNHSDYFRIGPSDKYVQPDAANFNSWRRHMKLNGVSPEEIVHAWEDVKAMFNGVRRLLEHLDDRSVLIYFECTTYVMDYQN